MKKRVGLIRRMAGALLFLMAAWMIFSPTAIALRGLPEVYRLTIGETCEMRMGVAVLSSQDERLGLKENTFLPSEAVDTEVSINLLGIFRIGRIRVNAAEEIRLMPGGEAVGVALATKGVLVIGVSDVAGKSPAQTAGLRAGDIIMEVNGLEMESSDQLIALVNEGNGKDMQILFVRDGREKQTVLHPQLDPSSGKWRIGAWVRDSTAGVGTLSFFNPENHSYGALGHAINDGDTGKLLPIRMGALMKADIVDIRKGKKGTPGELRGSFLQDQVLLGDIEKNTNLGIYGRMEKEYVNPLYPEGLPVGYQETVHEGPAMILSTVEGKEMKAYEVEIVQVTRQTSPAPKSMVIHVTDPKLIEKTGGIVQGMSGSPIIQDGKIIGAVTHV